MWNHWNTLAYKAQSEQNKRAGLRDKEDGEPKSTLVVPSHLQRRLQNGYEEKFHKVRRKAGENAQESAALALCCFDHEQRLMRRVEDVVSRVSAAFDKNIRWLFEHNHLAYIPFPPMMPLVRIAMSFDPSHLHRLQQQQRGPLRSPEPTSHLPYPQMMLLLLLDAI
ncbi:hypothetical protein M9H77_00229 [Catharanthus roseus]|nr:hypothetical protein M9H77_00229 [Catharanthus roseus]